MKKVLVSWIGHADLRAEAEQHVGLGPIAQAVMAYDFEQVALLSDASPEITAGYTEWLTEQMPTTITVFPTKLSSPTDFGEIYQADVDTVTAILARHPRAQLFFHLSPGTPAMAAVWILLAKTRFPAQLLESSIKHGVKKVEVPFDISADFIPALLKNADEHLEALSAGLPPRTPEFDQIIHRSSVMSKVIVKARRIAIRSVPVLVQGESGTGKEMLANAIHGASTRRGKPFLAVNCGAIPPDLVEAEFFGYRRGAFTGAAQDRAGHFEAASGGTLFLDEIGELPLLAQVKILRALQGKEVVRLGDHRPVQVDVRIIAATNRDLLEEVAAGRFRGDLYYRLAVAVLSLPPLREREGDVSLLIDHMLEQINREGAADPGFVRKNISASARNFMLSYPWPGNAREVFNTLYRAAIWSMEEKISLADVREILPSSPETVPAPSHEFSLDRGVNLPEILNNVAREHLAAAMREARGNKTKAARLLCLPNYQTLSNWLQKYGVTG
ncbi:sigma-54 dependent transcriptional regulator [Geomonas paludis]|uniref:Sigma-54 dependent transcriptional regulator n=1 Tax=Geomonas paludis TaxID=2740185 RepID=A0ABY4LKF5_9BACT|nr:sigma-54 dependent transcriptional regulator [Geomonas paludis]UPU37495.1 sigma-54 dependent transcriptional regulator [Geomonas paludis]